jgi:hypothetical protein
MSSVGDDRQDGNERRDHPTHPPELVVHTDGETIHGLDEDDEEDDVGDVEPIELPPR